MFTRSRNFVFTLNNPTFDEYAFWEELCSSERARNKVQCSYCVYQEERHDVLRHPERGPYSRGQRVLGTKHLQGYVECTRAIRLAGIKRRFGPRCHFEQRRGTQSQAILYCQKEETRLAGGATGEGGEPKKLGKDKLSFVAAKVKEGKESISSLSIDYPGTFIKFGPKIVSYALNLKPHRDEAPKIFILFGKTGTGKTAVAHKKWPNCFWIPHPQKGGWWWTNYQGEKCVGIDEMRNGIMQYSTCLKFFDRYEMTVQVKGTCMKMLGTTIIITTNIDPIRWYPGLTWEAREPLRRRLHDFAKIWDVEDDSTWDDFKYTVRNPITI